MSLKDKKSLYDRNTRMNLGPNVGTTLPQDGDFYTDFGNIASPYDVPLTTAQGATPQSDQMIELLNNEINTTTGNNYQPAPSKSPFQDLEGIDIVSNTPPKYEDNPPT